MHALLTVAQHELDVLADVPESVDPHESHQLPESCPEHGEASAVSVHQVQDVLAGPGNIFLKKRKLTAFPKYKFY